MIIAKIGYYKWRTERVTGYLQRGGTLVVFIASLKILEMNLLWLIVLPIAFVILWYMDKYLFYPGESEAATRENPEWRRLMAQFNPPTNQKEKS